MAFLMSSLPQMEGAMERAMMSWMSGLAAIRRNSSSSSGVNRRSRDVRPVPGHLAVGNGVGRFLQLQNLEVVALDLVRHDEVGVQGALSLAGLLGRAGGGAFAGKGVTLETGRDPDVGNHR